jgi:bacterioferritin
LGLLFESLIADEERHFDGYDKQVEAIKKFGPSYLALQSFNSNPAAGQPPPAGA